MKLKILGSSSKGNGYLLIGENETLIIEAGINIKQVKKELNFNLSNVVGCLISHSHGDHSKYTSDFLKTGISCYMTKETIEALNINHYRLHKIIPEQMFNIGNFKILPFSTKHDCPGSVGFLIKHNELGTLLFATDTFYLEYKFPNVNHIMIEANYDKNILVENILKGYIPDVVAKRVFKSHFELSNLKEFFKANDLTKTKEIILIHLSDNNSDAKRFKKEIEELTFKTVYIAEEGLELSLHP
ncbi:Metal-dependent hydrolase [Marinitoga phage MPV1]|uniref:Metal-dependent hydrolase, beta-lactamase superfamily I n=1 Tax=Marinitoga piezophila (strain DSM 14283 / JCM 11233 / KA3) TaxID=443254 RepID=H2J425_MARPK|nr:MBL fold metallo-hydrolase [Marinitoga piezophila]AEX84753.1 metal-dependent hydrolase, beta-lactamase superfamily I [Marinitoga piezophila KA3]